MLQRITQAWWERFPLPRSNNYVWALHGALGLVGAGRGGAGPLRDCGLPAMFSAMPASDPPRPICPPQASTTTAWCATSRAAPARTRRGTLWGSCLATSKTPCLPRSSPPMWACAARRPPPPRPLPPPRPSLHPRWRSPPAAWSESGAAGAAWARTGRPAQGSFLYHANFLLPCRLPLCSLALWGSPPPSATAQHNACMMRSLCKTTSQYPPCIRCRQPQLGQWRRRKVRPWGECPLPHVLPGELQGGTHNRGKGKRERTGAWRATGMCRGRAAHQGCAAPTAEHAQARGRRQ